MKNDKEIIPRASLPIPMTRFAAPEAFAVFTKRASFGPSILTIFDYIFLADRDKVCGAFLYSTQHTSGQNDFQMNAG